MLDCLESVYPGYSEKLQSTIKHVRFLSNVLKKEDDSFSINDSIGFLDALCDQIVTATGVGTFLGMNVPGAMEEVNRSNFSKFVNGEPLFDKNKKVMKGPDYSKPDLTPFI